VNILPGEDTRSFAGKINRYGRKVDGAVKPACKIGNPTNGCNSISTNTLKKRLKCTFKTRLLKENPASIVEAGFLYFQAQVYRLRTIDS